MAKINDPFRPAPNANGIVDPFAPTPAAPAEPEGVSAADYLRQAGGGALSALGYGIRGAAEGIMAPSKGDAPVLDVSAAARLGSRIADYGNEVAGNVSEAAKQAIAGSTPDGKITDPSTWSFGEDPSAAGYGLQVANTLGQVAPMLAAGLATKGRVLPSAAVGAAVGGGAAADAEEQRILGMDQAELDKVPGYQKRVAQGMNPADARASLARAAARASFKQTAPVSAADALIEVLPFTGRAQQALGRVVGPSRAARVLAGGVGGAAGEGLQEVAENASQVIGADTATGEHRDPMEGSLAQGLLGALGGAPVAAAAGLLPSEQHQQQPTRDEQQPGYQPAPSEDVPAASGEPAQPGEQAAPTPAAPTHAQTTVVRPEDGPLSHALTSETGPVAITTPLAPADTVEAAKKPPKEQAAEIGARAGKGEPTPQMQADAADAEGALGGTFNPHTGEIAPDSFGDPQGIVKASPKDPAAIVGYLTQQAANGALPGVPMIAKVYGLDGPTARAYRQQAQAAANAASTNQEQTDGNASVQSQQPDGGRRPGEPGSDGAAGRGQVPAGQEGAAVQEEGRQEEGQGQEGQGRQAQPVRGQALIDPSGEQLDDDITTPSGAPFSIKGAADLQAKRHPGSSVVALDDGGFVVRLPTTKGVSDAVQSTTHDPAGHLAGADEGRTDGATGVPALPPAATGTGQADQAPAADAAAGGAPVTDATIGEATTQPVSGKDRSELRKHGREVDSHAEALAHLRAGDRVFGFSEMDGKPVELTNEQAIENHAADQIMVLGNEPNGRVTAAVAQASPAQYEIARDGKGQPRKNAAGETLYEKVRRPINSTATPVQPAARGLPAPDSSPTAGVKAAEPADQPTTMRKLAQVIDNSAVNPGQFIVKGSDGITNYASFELGKNGKPTKMRRFHHSEEAKQAIAQAIEAFQAERAPTTERPDKDAARTKALDFLRAHPEWAKADDVQPGIHGGVTIQTGKQTPGRFDFVPKQKGNVLVDGRHEFALADLFKERDTDKTPPPVSGAAKPDKAKLIPTRRPDGSVEYQVAPVAADASESGQQAPSAPASAPADRATSADRSEPSGEASTSVSAESTANVGESLANGTAPEHVTGVDDRELGEIVDEFNAAQASMIEGGHPVSNVFAKPAKGERVRLADKVKAYVAGHGWMTPAEAAAKVKEWKEHAAAQGKTRDNANRVVLSLFDLSGEWSKPWEEAGYHVVRFDIQDDWTYEEEDPETGEMVEKRAGDVHNFSPDFFEAMFGHFDGNDVYAILAACPCTDFAVSGARHFAAKDADGRTVASVKLVHQTLATIEYFKPQVWAIENPVGRIENLGGLPPWTTSFDPNAFGEDYTKKTLLWGRHNGDMPVAPTEATAGSKMHRLYGGKSMATKNARSVTPEGFAYAFFMANNAIDHPELEAAWKYDRLDRALVEEAVKAGLTLEEINGLVEDYYYQDLDDQAAEEALREAIDERVGDAAAPRVLEKGEDVTFVRGSHKGETGKVLWHAHEKGSFSEGKVSVKLPSGTVVTTRNEVAPSAEYRDGAQTTARKAAEALTQPGEAADNEAGATLPAQPEPSNDAGLQLESPESGGAGALAPAPADAVRAPGGKRQARGGADRSGAANARADGRAEQGGDERRRGVARGSKPVPDSGTDGGPARVDDLFAAQDAADAVAHAPGETGLEQPRGAPASNYVIPAELGLGEGGAKAKFNGNLDAIRLLKTLEREHRDATPEEQAVLARYVGWGGIPQAFNDPRTGKGHAGWEKQAAALAAELTPEELEAARASTQNAHYTSREVIGGIYTGLARLGFTGGAVLEPSVGTGNFLGLAPAQLRGNMRWTAVELDSITGRIAAKLYPQARVLAGRGFQDVTVPLDHFDAAIGNPPFGSTKLFDAQHKDLRTFSIHNFFFAKSLKSLRPGGVLAMVVSHQFLDKTTSTQRRWIAERARLLGAIRLPDTAFKANAGTEVTTDIVFLQKLHPGESADTGWTQVGTTPDPAGGEAIPLNRYFLDHPEMLLGDMTRLGQMRAANMPTLTARQGLDLNAALAAAVDRLPANVMDVPTPLQPGDNVPGSDLHVAAVPVYGHFVTPDGNIRQRLPDQLDEQQFRTLELGATDTARMSAMIGLRDELKALLAAELDDRPTAQLDRMRAGLNTSYDRFAKKFGYLNSQKNVALFREDADAFRLRALEVAYTRLNPEEAAAEGLTMPKGRKTLETAQKADVLSKRVLSPERAPKAATAQDALIVSLNTTGRVDPAAMARMLGREEADVIAELGGKLYLDPVAGWVTDDQYLSGNVKEKLAKARVAAKEDPQYERNVDALVAVQPADIAPADIAVLIGAPWVPSSDLERFALDVLGVKATITWDRVLSKFSVRASTHGHDKFATSRRSAADLLGLALNRQPGTVYDIHKKPGGGEERVINAEETAAATAALNELGTQFDDWIWTDPERRERLSRIYNDHYNTDRQRSYDGSFLSFPGMSDEIRLRPSQKNAVWRMVQEGRSLLDHVVGAGKTYTIVAAAMTAKRMGLQRKPMIAVPNHLVGQWAGDFIRLYPGAKVLAVTKQDFEKDRRKLLFSRIATGDWDAVIVAHSQFTRISVPADFEQSYLEEMVADYEQAIDAAKAAKGGEDRMTIKQLAQRRDALTAKLKSRMDRTTRDEDTAFMDEMGIDALYVDEAHEFKNLEFVTSKRNVAGLGNPAGSQKAADLFMKSRYMLRAHRGAGLHFATGTPVSNSLVEMFTMQRYLAEDDLRARGIASFDAWANTFAQEEVQFQIDSTGRGLKPKTVLTKFLNAAEMMAIYWRFADIVLQSDLKRMHQEAYGTDFPIPKVKGGGPQNLLVAPNPALSRYIEQVIIPRTQAIAGEPVTITMPDGSVMVEHRQKPDPSVDNMLKVTNDARLAALDIRLRDPAAPDHPDSKTNRAVREIRAIWEREAGRRGTQLVFCDLSTPKAAVAAERAELLDLQRRAREGDEDAIAALERKSPDEILALESSFSVYDDMRAKLIASGVPANEVAFIHDAKTDLQKAALFTRVRAGQVRILFGSTAKMGAGTNVQNKLVALHHLDAPWRPSDLEQREGRGIRQGNEFYAADPDGFELEINRYATERTYDSRQWQLIEQKAGVIEQIRRADATTREIDDIGGQAASAAEMKAAATGNPLIIEQVELQDRVKRLTLLKRSYDNRRYDTERNLRTYEADGGPAGREAAALEKARKVTGYLKQHPRPDPFALTLGKKTHNEYAAAANAMGVAVVGAAEDMKRNGAQEQVLGEYRGLTLTLGKSEIGRMLELRLTAPGGIALEPVQGLTNLEGKVSGDGILRKIDNVIKREEAAETEIKATRKYEERRIAELRDVLAQPFKAADELAGATARLREVTASLTAKPAAPEAGKLEAEILPEGGAQARPSEDRGPVAGVAQPALLRAVQSAMKDWTGDIPTVRVVETADALPIEARRQAGWERAEGWYDGYNAVYLVAGNLPNLSRGLQVLAHEAFGHYGVEGIMDREAWSRVVGDVAKLRKTHGAGLSADLRAVLGSVEARYGDESAAQFAREFLAVMAERGVKTPLLARVLSALRRWLRALGFNLEKFSDAELRTTLADGIRHVRRSGQRTRTGSLTQPAQAELALAPHAGASLRVASTTEATDTIEENGSGDSSASLEAIRRQREEKALGRARMVINADGTTYPLIGVDAVDTTARPGQIIVQRNVGADEWTVLSQDPALSPSVVAGRINAARSSLVTNMAFSLAEASPSTFFDAIATARKEASEDGLIARLKDKLEDWRPAMLGTLTLRQLAEIGAQYLPAGQHYVDVMTKMATRRNLLQQDVGELAAKWEAMQRADRRKATAAQKAARDTDSDRTVDVMHAATIAGVDPAEQYRAGVLTLHSDGEKTLLDATEGEATIARLQARLDEKKTDDATKRTLRQDIARVKAGMERETERRAAYPALVRQFAQLPKEWQDLYREVRDAYTTRADALLDALLARIEALEMDAREKKALVDRMRANFESARIEAPYFPLSRFGEFWAAFEKPGKDGEIERQFVMAETKRARDQAIKAAEAAGYTLTKKGRKIDNVRAQDGASSGFVSEVSEMLAEAHVDEKVRDEVYQLYLRTLPDVSIRRQFIHRKKVAGYDNDALRAFAGQMFHGAHQLSKLEYGLQLADVLAEIVKQAKAAQDMADADADRASAAANEFKKRHEWVMNPTNASWAQKASSLNFIFYLGLSPASALVNLTQTAIVSYPALASRYGAMKALQYTAQAMTQASRTLGAAGTLRETLTDAGERAAFDQLLAMGALDVTQAHDLAGLADGDTRNYDPLRYKAMNLVSSLFHRAEVINREATGLAAYRLAKDAGESHDAAIRRAADTIWQTHYDYSNANRSRLMQGDAAKVLFAFKQYAQSTTYYLWRAFYEATKGESPEVRKIARNRLLGTLGMTGVFTGVMGMPLLSLMFGIANAMASVFGDDDEPWDAEVEFRNFLADHLPPTLAAIAQEGVVEGGLGAFGIRTPEIGSRVSLDQLWFRKPDQEVEGRDLYTYMLEQIAGPMVGALGNVVITGPSMVSEGLETGNGDLMWRGIEKMLPKAARDGMKALRYASTGVNTVRGDPLVADVGVADVVYQGLGFMPSEVSRQYELNAATKRYEGYILDRRQALLDGYALAYRLRDPEAIRKALGKIRAFNDAHRELGINANTIRRSLQSRQKFSERAVNGVAVNPKLKRSLAERIRFDEAATAE